MKKLYIIDDLKANTDFEKVMRAIGCKSDKADFADFKREFNFVCIEAARVMKPVGIIGFGRLTEETATEKYPPDSRVIYAVISIGDELHKHSSSAFADGSYIRGLLYNAVADTVLFSFEEQLKSKLEDICRENNVGIGARLEISRDVSVKVQKEAWRQLELKERFGIDITDGYMFDPIKTLCQVFAVTDDTACFNAHHNCGECPNVDCNFRIGDKARIYVSQNGRKDVLYLRKNEPLSEVLARGGYAVNAVCGGNGRCGKCAVRVIGGDIPICRKDSEVFSQGELNDGWRLACKLYPKNGITVELKSEEKFDVLSEYVSGANVKADICENERKSKKYEVAADIGTTTVVLQLSDSADGRICHTVSQLNHQRRYGADVVSRINAAVSGSADDLKAIIRNDLKNGIETLCAEYGVETRQLERIAVSANTTMLHLLMGYDCKTLGQYPFTPVSIGLTTGAADKITGISSGADVVLLPGISAYVGADIVSGLYACGFDRSDDVCMLIDLGTNGEMALGNRDKILVASTAAGPAFEGGNIKCGIGSVEGAVCSAVLNGESVRVRTIGNKSPVGICGTGVAELTAELLREGFIDKTGLLNARYFDSGFTVAKTMDGRDIVFTQKDIREFQMAKAAIRAGTEILLRRYGITGTQVSRVYIAGGFGYALDVRSAVGVGMIPSEFENRVSACGNTSLAGAVKFLRDKQAKKTVEKIVEVSEEISLSLDDEFNELYLKSMMFSDVD